MTRATDLAAVYEFDMPDRMRKTLRHSSETAASMARYLDVDGEVSGVAEVVELHPIELDPAA